MAEHTLSPVYPPRGVCAGTSGATAEGIAETVSSETEVGAVAVLDAPFTLPEPAPPQIEPARSRLDLLWLRGRCEPWGAVGVAVIAVSLVVGLWLRLHQLSAEGFADDEVHKWLAANRYLHGSFSGDDAEHPMLMKWLIALCISVLPGSWAPETLTRLPNAIAGIAVIWLVAQLGRRLFGRLTGGLAAALAAVSPTLIGYQRVAKEDTLVGVFMILMLWCAAEAAAAEEEKDATRWELGTALSLAGMLASKYYVFFILLPPFVYLWLRQSGTGRRLSFARWAWLSALALLAFLALNWTPLMPETWAYLKDHLAGRHVVTPSLFFMGKIYKNLPSHLVDGVPPQFFFVFTAVKLTPVVLALALVGLARSIWQHAPAQRVIMAWVTIWFATWLCSGGKYGRYFVSVLPAFLIFAAYAVSELVQAAQRYRTVIAGALSALAVGSEAQAAIRLAPHYRLYVSPIAGGDENLDWFFPHCDYFDAGFREAVEEVAARAERGAELTSEIDLPAGLYAERAGRADLKITLFRREIACKSGVPCYVIVQPGRIYLHNRDAWEALGRRTPWAVERVEGHAAATVYRLEPGEAVFPAE